MTVPSNSPAPPSRRSAPVTRPGLPLFGGGGSCSLAGRAAGVVRGHRRELPSFPGAPHPRPAPGARSLHEKESYSFKFEKWHRAARIDSPRKGGRFLAKTGEVGGGCEREGARK